jgi:hypothetical protein
MPNRGKRVASPTHKVQHVSSDDVQALVIERDRLAAMDTRTEAERWLGDPPPHRSALAQQTRAAGSAITRRPDPALLCAYIESVR